MADDKLPDWLGWGKGPVKAVMGAGERLNEAAHGVDPRMPELAKNRAENVLGGNFPRLPAPHPNARVRRDKNVGVGRNGGAAFEANQLRAQQQRQAAAMDAGLPPQPAVYTPPDEKPPVNADIVGGHRRNEADLAQNNGMPVPPRAKKALEGRDAFLSEVGGKNQKTFNADMVRAVNKWAQSVFEGGAKSQAEYNTARELNGVWRSYLADKEALTDPKIDPKRKEELSERLKLRQKELQAYIEFAAHGYILKPGAGRINNGRFELQNGGQWGAAAAADEKVDANQQALYADEQKFQPSPPGARVQAPMRNVDAVEAHIADNQRRIAEKIKNDPGNMPEDALAQPGPQAGLRGKLGFSRDGKPIRYQQPPTTYDAARQRFGELGGKKPPVAPKAPDMQQEYDIARQEMALRIDVANAERERAAAKSKMPPKPLVPAPKLPGQKPAPAPRAPGMDAKEFGNRQAAEQFVKPPGVKAPQPRIPDEQPAPAAKPAPAQAAKPQPKDEDFEKDLIAALTAGKLEIRDDRGVSMIVNPVTGGMVPLDEVLPYAPSLRPQKGQPIKNSRHGCAVKMAAATMPGAEGMSAGSLATMQRYLDDVAQHHPEELQKILQQHKVGEREHQYKWLDNLGDSTVQYLRHLAGQKPSIGGAPGSKLPPKVQKLAQAVLTDPATYRRSLRELHHELIGAGLYQPGSRPVWPDRERMLEVSGKLKGMGRLGELDQYLQAVAHGKPMLDHEESPAPTPPPENAAQQAAAPPQEVPCHGCSAGLNEQVQRLAKAGLMVAPGAPAQRPVDAMQQAAPAPVKPQPPVQNIELQRRNAALRNNNATPADVHNKAFENMDWLLDSVAKKKHDEKYAGVPNPPPFVPGTPSTHMNRSDYERESDGAWMDLTDNMIQPVRTGIHRHPVASPRGGEQSIPRVQPKN